MTPATDTKFHGEPQLEHICSFWATVGTPEIIGPLAEGLRLNFYLTGGEVFGPKMRGRLLPVGGDWVSLRPDGIGVMDIRATLALDDGALIYMTYNGIADLGPDGYERFLAGNPPAKVQARVTPRFYTGHAAYLWANRIQCFGIGEVDMQQLKVSYDIYALR
jgi:hypothetical protein